MKKKYYDLSGTIENGMWDYSILPSLKDIIPETDIRTIAAHDKDGFFSSGLELSTVTGTYLEAGSHILEQGRHLDSYGLADFIRPAAVIRLPGLEPKHLISRSELETHAPSIEEGDALIIGTGWSRNWNKEGYVLECPNYSPEAVDWILGHKISILGVDVPCIEAAWSDEAEVSKGGLLEKIFVSGALLAAPLAGVENIEERLGTLFCFPLKLKGTSGSPARIVFVPGE